MDLKQSTFILDTSAYSSFYRGDSRLRKWFDSKYVIYMPLIVIGELKAGFAGGSRRNENEDLLERFLESSNVEILPITLTTTEKYADLFSQLKKAGTPVGTNDIWIAALALEHNLSVLTLDTDFSRIKGIEINII